MKEYKDTRKDQLERCIACRPFIFHSPLNQQSGNQQKGKTTQVQRRAEPNTTPYSATRYTTTHHPTTCARRTQTQLTANYSTRALHYAALQAHHGLPRKPGKHNRCPSPYPSTHRQKHAQTHLRMHYHRRPGSLRQLLQSGKQQHSDRRPNK